MEAINNNIKVDSDSSGTNTNTPNTTENQGPTYKELLEQRDNLIQENQNLVNTLNEWQKNNQIVSNLEAQNFAIQVALNSIKLRQKARKEKINWFDLVNNPMVGGQITPKPNPPQ